MPIGTRERPVERPKVEIKPESKKNHGSDGSSTKKEEQTEESLRPVVIQHGTEERVRSAEDTAEQLPGQMSVENYPEMLPLLLHPIQQLSFQRRYFRHKILLLK